MEVGRGKGVWGRDPQNKHLQSAHVLLRVSPHQCPPSVPLTDVSLASSWELSEVAEGCWPALWTRHVAVFSNSQALVLILTEPHNEGLLDHL